ncbi:uncharacterized protein LOC142333207 isoform X2 [Lycorma delicatula]
MVNLWILVKDKKPSQPRAYVVCSLINVTNVKLIDGLNYENIIPEKIYIPYKVPPIGYIQFKMDDEKLSHKTFLYITIYQQNDLVKPVKKFRNLPNIDHIKSQVEFYDSENENIYNSSIGDVVFHKGLALSKQLTRY